MLNDDGLKLSTTRAGKCTCVFDDAALVAAKELGMDFGANVDYASSKLVRRCTFPSMTRVKACAVLMLLGIVANGCKRSSHPTGVDDLKVVCAQRWRLTKLIEGTSVRVAVKNSVVFRCESLSESRAEVIGKAYVNLFSVQARRNVDGSVDWDDYEGTSTFAPDNVVAEEAHFRQLWLATNHWERQGKNLALVSIRSGVRLEFEPSDIPFEFERKK